MKIAPWFARAAIACALFLAPTGLFAHPHMFIDCTADFVWDKAQLSGCYLEWTLDQFFSADIIQAYDENRDGKFNAAETKLVHDNAFINLKNYYYFTFIRQGSKRTNPPEVSKFSVRQKDGKLIYRFFVDLSQTAPGELDFACYDYTFFCDISYPGSAPIKLTYDGAFVSPSYAIVENKDYPVYYNPLGAIDDTTIYYKWKQGLQTYYPREIRITYAK